MELVYKILIVYVIPKKGGFMKLLSLSALFSLLAQFAFANGPQCPENHKKVWSCLSSPQKGDSELVSDMFDSISICSSQEQTLVLFEKRGEAKALIAEVSNRVGGTAYTGSADDVDFELSITGGIRPRKEYPARFTLRFTAIENTEASSSYSCQR